MSSLAVQVVTTTLLFLGFIYVRIYRYINYPCSIPRVGKPGVLGFILTAVRYTADPEAVIAEGRAKYGNQPFTVPTLVIRVLLPCPVR
ncbi:hypothetical protein P691DRAFT_237004 [Macrolepiota fuliginosa MF-IS2]|uniref:Uncharacterized protein n=1 Tax=Macrolepiota fuliginosa MF-IS2 TaxID=1400762 RepID=A0A9P5XL07_9AGAR|nr:hypothetical protein P691DRAFT_237004 [Macrolepiota fuliginosa MF-IS2]